MLNFVGKLGRRSGRNKNKKTACVKEGTLLQGQVRVQKLEYTKKQATQKHISHSQCMNEYTLP